MKKCSWCLEEKALSEFTKLTRSSDGLNSSCKDCIKRRRTDAYAKIREHECSVDGCSKPAYTLNPFIMCGMHRNRWLKYGDVGPAESYFEHGSSFVDSGGYVVLCFRNERAYEHRKVMEEVLGRKLLPGENVHHKNGVRHDNRRENLELWSTRQPSGQTIDDKVTWCVEFLRDYAPHLLV